MPTLFDIGDIMDSGIEIGGSIFDSIKPLVFLFIGLQIGFFIVEKIIGVIYKKITGGGIEIKKSVREE